MHLGEADSFSADQSELYYSSRINRGGIAVLLPAAGGGAGYLYDRWLERTLYVEFDKDGLVTSARLHTESCSENFFGLGVQSNEQRRCVAVDEPAAPGDAPKAGGPEPGP